MGGAFSSSARQLALHVAPRGPRKLKPFSPHEIEALNRMAEKDQARIRDLPSMEDLNTKDAMLDGLLSKLGGSIAGRDLSPDEPPRASTSGQTSVAMPPARPPQALRAAAAASWKMSVQSVDDHPGRLQSYIIRELLEGRTAAAAELKELDLEPYVRMYGADRAKLVGLMEVCCLPAVGKVATFGHQYAFARPPQWWMKGGGISGAKFLSEPDELQRRLMGNPVAVTAAAAEEEERGYGAGGDGGGAVGGIFGGGGQPTGMAAAAPAAAGDTGRSGSGSGRTADGRRGNDLDLKGGSGA